MEDLAKGSYKILPQGVRTFEERVMIKPRSGSRNNHPWLRIPRLMGVRLTIPVLRQWVSLAVNFWIANTGTALSSDGVWSQMVFSRFRSFVSVLFPPSTSFSGMLSLEFKWTVMILVFSVPPSHGSYLDRIWIWHIWASDLYSYKYQFSGQRMELGKYVFVGFPFA